jgi:hypothetical protein
MKHAAPNGAGEIHFGRSINISLRWSEIIPFVAGRRRWSLERNHTFRRWPSTMVAGAKSYLPCLGLDGRDRDGVNDVVCRAAAREIVCRFVQALQDWADGGCAC